MLTVTQGNRKLLTQVSCHPSPARSTSNPHLCVSYWTHTFTALLAEGRRILMSSFSVATSHRILRRFIPVVRYIKVILQHSITQHLYMFPMILASYLLTVHHQTFLFIKSRPVKKYPSIWDWDLIPLQYASQNLTKWMYKIQWNKCIKHG